MGVCFGTLNGEGELSKGVVPMRRGKSRPPAIPTQELGGGVCHERR
ncbi:hypothetical protein [Pasteuria penetrans]|nr:hypothetical protein [Pasteuria penetrans]